MSGKSRTENPPVPAPPAPAGVRRKSKSSICELESTLGLTGEEADWAGNMLNEFWSLKDVLKKLEPNGLVEAPGRAGLGE